MENSHHRPSIDEVMVKVCIYIGCHLHGLSKRPRSILGDLLSGIAVAGIVPLVDLLRKIRVVWFLRADADHAESKLGKASIDALDAI